MAYVSKSVTTTEQNYVNIERDFLAVLHGLETFHHFTYASHVHVKTDHKPLLSIVKKDIINVPPRLARVLLRVHKFHLTLHYRPGKQMFMSDVLN